MRAVLPTTLGAIGSALALVCAAVPAQAQSDGPGLKEGQSRWGIGIGGGSKQKAYAGIDRDNEVLPLLEYENQYVHILGPVAAVKLPSLALADQQRLDFRLVARYAIFGGYESDDAPILNGMEDRRDGFWAGGKVEWKNPIVNVSAELLSDLGVHSNGKRFSLGLERNFRLGQQVMLAPRLVAAWQDRKYNDYYYGVRTSEAVAGRPAYEADAGVNTELGLRFIYLFDKQNSILVDASVTSLSSEIKNSPLVDRSTENRIFAAYVYRF